MTPPIFIIGHWRSGTTHIANLLSQSPRFRYVSPVATGLPHELLTLGKWLKPWLEKSIPPDRLIDQVKVTARSPQEDEFGLANMLPFSFLHALYFPKHFVRNFEKGVFHRNWSETEMRRWKNAHTKFLRKVYIDQQKRQLIIRNPAYTTRIPLLQELWPGAKFIHIYRNPYQVFPSMRNYFHKLLPALALQDFAGVNIDDVVFTTFRKMMETAIEDLANLPTGDYIEVSYEQLEQAPVAILKEIYTRLGLQGFEEAAPHFKQYLNGIREYTKNQYRQDQQEKELINKEWGRIIEYYGY
jgi:hypothetical protein